MRPRTTDSTERVREIEARMLAQVRQAIADSQLSHKQVAASVWPHLAVDNAERALSEALAGREPLTIARAAAVYALCGAVPRPQTVEVQASLAELRAQQRDILRRLEALIERTEPRKEAAAA